MLPDVFVNAIKKACEPAFTIEFATLQLPWPDEPMEHGYLQAGLAGLKEYQGDPEQIVKFLQGAEIWVNHLAPLSKDMMAQLPDLKFIAVGRGGPVNIESDALESFGIQMVNVPGRNSTAVAEFTIGAILAETRLIRAGHEALRQGNWRGDLYRADLTGSELSELTVGLVGYGEVGTKVVKLLKVFGCQILVCDPYVKLSEDDAQSGVKQVQLDDLLQQSDVVSLHARVSQETTHLMNASTLSKMKQGSFLINTARGPIVNYDDLYQTLKSGHLRGAMLETFAVEPPPEDWDLLKLPNVTLTPHIAGASTKTVSYTAECLAKEIQHYLHGKPPINPFPLS